MTEATTICRDILSTPPKFSLKSWLHFLLLMIQIIPNTFSDAEVWTLGWTVHCF